MLLLAYELMNVGACAEYDHARAHSIVTSYPDESPETGIDGCETRIVSIVVLPVLSDVLSYSEYQSAP